MKKKLLFSSIVLFFLGFVLFVDGSSGGAFRISRFETISQFVDGIIAVIYTLSLAIIPLVIIYSGYLFVTAMGNQDQIQKAKNTLTYAVVGLVVIILARGIVGFVLREFGI